MKTLRFVLALICALTTLAFSTTASAQAYPNRPVKMIVAFGPGSGTDIVARHLGEILARNLNQSFIIDNRAGAAGNIGLAAGAKSPADGYTLVFGGLGVNAINQFLFAPGSMGFDPEKDLDPVILISRNPFLITVSPSFNGSSLADLIAAAKAKPGSVNVAISSTTTRILYELMNRAAGIQLFPILYKTPASAIIDVVAGRVTVAVETAATLRPHVASGSLKGMAITSKASSDVMPGVRSVAEQGIPGFEFVGWVSLYAPKGTPRAAINLINAELNKILALPETRKRFLDLGAEAGSGSAQDLQDFEDAERRRYGPLIKSAGIKAE